MMNDSSYEQDRIDEAARVALLARAKYLSAALADGFIGAPVIDVDHVVAFADAVAAYLHAGPLAAGAVSP